MKIHPREQIVREARIKLGQFLLEMRSKDVEDGGLTDIEFMQLVLHELSDTLGGHFKYALRFERHGDPDKASGLAYDDDKKPT